MFWCFLLFTFFTLSIIFGFRVEYLFVIAIIKFIEWYKRVNRPKVRTKKLEMPEVE